MPRKDYDQYREYMRSWYARPENRKRTIEKVTRRKREDYAGVCINCGGPTTGESNISRAWCGKPECRRVANKPYAVPEFLLTEVLALAVHAAKLEDQVAVLKERNRALEKEKKK